MSPSSPSAGGFILSPPPSSIASSDSPSKSKLPHPRHTPLRPGGSKESAFIRHLDSQILHIQRRYAKRTAFSTNAFVNGAAPPVADAWPGDVRGYASMKEACLDIEALVDVVWISGTPSLQVPYLINLALLLATVVGGMPPSPRRLFRLVDKLDRAFAGLLQGRDVESGEALPGFEGGRGISGTEKVRIRSLVERTRIGVMEAFKRAEFEFDEPEEDEEAAEEMDVDGAGHDGELIIEGDDFPREEEDDDSWDMQLARVYDRTIVELGDSLEEPNIGIITEGRSYSSARWNG